MASAALLLGVASLVGAPRPAGAVDADDPVVPYAAAVVGTEGVVSPDVVVTVRAGVEEWLKRSGYALLLRAPDELSTIGAATTCLGDADCRDRLALKVGLQQIAVVHLRASDGGRVAAHVEVLKVLSGKLSIQWMGLLLPSEPAAPLRELPSLGDAPTGTLAVSRTPADAQVTVAGWPVAAGPGDIVVGELLARSYDVRVTAPGHEPGGGPVTVAPGATPTELRVDLARMRTGGGSGLWIGVGVGAGVVVAGAVVAVLVAVLAGGRPPRSDLGHDPVFGR